MDVKTQKKLNYLDETKQLIRAAIEEKGQTINDSDSFRSYVDKVRAITTGGGSAKLRYVTFKDDTGTVEYGKKAVAVGDDCADPIARGIFSTPTKESTDQYNFTFSGGWATTPGGGKDSNALKNVTEDRTVYANFIAAVRYYTVTYYDSDGTTVLKTESLAYGSMPSYKPVKEGATFTMWNPNTAVTGDMSYTAMWEEKITFANASWEKIGEIAQSGNATEFFAVGDEKQFTMSDGSTMTCVIVGFDCDDNYDTSKGKVPITIAMKNAVNVQTSIGSQITTSTYGAYSASEIHNVLINTVWPMLPQELKKVTKTVRKKEFTNSSTATRNCSTPIWAFSKKELGCSADETLGKTYQYFTTNATNKRKMKTSGGTAVSYWIRDQANFNRYMSYINTSGTDVSTSLSNSTKYYLHFGICI